MTVARLLLVFGLISFAMPGQLLAWQDDAAEPQAETENVSEDLVSGDESDDSHADESAEDHSSEEHASDDHGEDDHGSGSHDADPTHANLSDPRWEVVDFRTDIAFFTAIVFVLLLTGLYFTAWKPIMEGLEKRERRIADNIAQAEQAASDAEAKLAQYEAKLATAEEEAQAIVTEARNDAEAAGQKLIAAAQEEAVRVKDRSLADIESAKRVALNDLANQSSDVALSLAKRIVGREVKAEDHQGLIQEMLSKLPSNN